MADKETVIGAEIRISGEVRGDEDVLVRGRIDGRVQLTGALTVEAGAVVQADVQARAVIIAGVVLGNVTATESVRLGEKARVIGDIASPRVVIEAGAAYRGRVDMGDAELGAAAQARASARRASSADGEASTKAPPRLATPARAAASGGATMAPRVPSASTVARPAPPAAPKAASAAPRPPAPPSLPAATGGVASPPPWAKKKLRRR